MLNNDTTNNSSLIVSSNTMLRYFTTINPFLYTNTYTSDRAVFNFFSSNEERYGGF
jgi:hypothetical protein